MKNRAINTNHKKKQIAAAKKGHISWNVPHPIDMKGDLANNWEFFKESWTNYKIATELDTKNENIRVATLLVTIGKEALQIYCQLPIT